LNFKKNHIRFYATEQDRWDAENNFQEMDKDIYSKFLFTGKDEPVKGKEKGDKK
jgi:hypothetical protein